MKITDIETIPISLKLRSKYESRAGEHLTPRLLIKIHTDDGLTGIGETAEPFARTWAQTPWSIKTAIDHYFAPALKGKDPFDVERLTNEMDAALMNNNMAKDSLTAALYDIMGKATNLPIHKLLGGIAVERIPVAWCIGYESIEETVRQAKQSISQGMKAIKIKLMDHLGKPIDLEKIRRVREAVGPNISIRVDANGTYPSLKTLMKMEKYDLDLIEQPAAELRGMKQYVNSLNTPVLVDEYVMGVNQALEVLQSNAADIIAVKDYQVGGIYKAKQIYSMLKAYHVPCYFEGTIRSGIGTAATLQLVASVAPIPVSFYGCFPGPFLIEQQLVKESLRFSDGFLEVPSKQGIGVELDEQQLESVRTEI